MEARLDKQLVQYFSTADHSNPPFTEEILAPFRQDLEHFLRDSGLTPNWEIRPHQPMCLNILHCLNILMRDPDNTLFHFLIEGVGTGFQRDIPLSHCFPLSNSEDSEEPPLSAHLTNWQSAEEDIPLTRELVQQEIDKGWVFPFEGTLEDAQQQYPLGVALGKLGVAHSDGRSPRLVLDNTICGLNGRCTSLRGAHCHRQRMCYADSPCVIFQEIIWPFHWTLRRHTKGSSSEMKNMDS